MAKVFSQRLTHKDTLRNVHSVFIGEDFVVSSTNSIQVTRNLGGLFVFIKGNSWFILVKVEESFYIMALQNLKTVFLGIFVANFNRVTYSFPVTGASNSQGHLSFEVRLIKAREDAETVESLKLGVQILLVVRLIHVWVETNTIFVIGVEVVELYSVPPECDMGHF